jgi:hypothetical protein
MSWGNYLERIVIPYRVVLRGWPNGIQFNPHQLGSKSLMCCLSALNGTPATGPLCYWEKLTAEEHATYVKEFEAQDPKARKTRSDKRQKRVRKRRHDAISDDEISNSASHLSKEFVDDDDADIPE